MKTIRVRAVGDLKSPYHTPDGSVRLARYAGRGPWPEYAAMPDGEEVADISVYRQAIAVGDLELVEE
jgi:hypothetical protein